MSWGWLLVAAWLGFMVGYVLCGLLNFSEGLWPGDRDD